MADTARGVVARRVLGGLRKIITGEETGRPAWVRALAEGEDLGYFPRDGAAWTVHADLITLVGGVRALLLQTLHPAALTGVDEHSNYRQDALGRLNGTARWLTVTTFGSRDQADREAARVRAMHRRVQGEYVTASGERRPYAAGDQRFLAWVHVAFTDSFLAAHTAFGARAIPGGPDAYIREWATSGELLGLVEPARSLSAFERELASFTPELICTELTRRTLDFLRHPPLPRAAMPGYRLLFAAAVSTLSEAHREQLGLHQNALVRRGSRVGVMILLRVLRGFVGPTSPTIEAVNQRHDRLAPSRSES